MNLRMRQIRSGGAVLFGLGAAVALVIHLGLAAARGADDQAVSSGAPLNPTAAADEKAIRATADEFIKAFNAGDAKTIGAEWSDDAEYTDEGGQTYHGRAAIEKEYAALFKEHPGATITVQIDSIRFLGPDIAIEKGIAKVKMPKADAPSGARYIVTHARREGKWVIVVGRDAPYVSDSNEDLLKPLEWMIGEWQPDVKEPKLRIKSEWLAQHNFIKNTYIITVDGKSTMSGAQIIGWNPKLGRIVGWHFDAQGGFGDDVWTHDGKKWVSEATGVMRDGSESSAVNVITPVDANSFTWQSLKRTLDGVKLPDVGPVKLVRVAAAK